MIDPIKQDYINYRINNAKDALSAAKLLADNLHWNAAINRLYYCCFYAVSALLYKNNINAKKHSGLKYQFTLNFIKTGIIDKNVAKVYLRLFDWRQKGDYDDFDDFDKEKTLPLFEPVEKFLKTILTLIER